MSKNKANTIAGQPPGPPAPAQQKHITDNLNAQLGVIMVQMGRIMKAKVSDQDRADLIVENARKKLIEATDSFHSTLDDMEIEITRAKAVFLRDLEVLRARGKQPPSQAAALPAPAHISIVPPAPMVVNLEGFRPSGPAVPVAPMMATGGSPFVAARGIPKTEAKPVAPFPDMGAPSIPIPLPKSAAAAPFSRAKASPVDQKRPSPKQIKQPTPKQPHKAAPKLPTPVSARMANKPNPMANAQKQAPKPPASAPPAGPAVAPAPAPAPAPMAAMPVAPAAPMAPVAAAQPPPQPPPMTHVPHFTNATFTLDPVNNDSMMQTSGGDNNLDMHMVAMDTFGSSAPGGPGEGDLDHFFVISGDNSSANANANAESSEFNNVDDYMHGDFNFDSFE